MNYLLCTYTMLGASKAFKCIVSMSTLSHVLYRLPSIRFWVWICRFYLEICENFDRVSGKLMNDSEIPSISLMKNGASNYFRDTQCKQLTSKCHSFAPFAQFVHHISMDAGCCCCYFVYNLHSHIFFCVRHALLLVSVISQIAPCVNACRRCTYICSSDVCSGDDKS